MDIIWIKSAEGSKVDEVGSKAAGLARLEGLGFRTPAGFVITASAFRRFLDNAGLIATLSSLITCDDSDLWTPLLERLKRRIATASWPGDLRDAIAASFRTLTVPIAVRSSGISEDSRHSSFAGAFSSFLNLRTEEEALAAIRDCWTSAFSEKVVAYRTQNRAIKPEWLMGVIVQTMISSRKAGVMFTRAPYDEKKSLLLEAVAGGCERIVSGAPADLTVWIDRASRAVQRVEQPPSRRRRFEAGRSIFLKEEPMRRKRLLRRAEIDLLADAGLTIEAAFGSPQDIEWAITDSDLILLQTRPLTAYRGAGEEG
jgi:pyruvate, water dikinase